VGSSGGKVLENSRKKPEVGNFFVFSSPKNNALFARITAVKPFDSGPRRPTPLETSDIENWSDLSYECDDGTTGQISEEKAVLVTPEELEIFIQQAKDWTENKKSQEE
jgi:hypothetical protein